MRLADLDLYKLRDGIEDRLVAKAERLGTRPRAVFHAGEWLGRAMSDLREARTNEGIGNEATAREYVRIALYSLAIANRRSRGDYWR